MIRVALAAIVPAGVEGRSEPALERSIKILRRVDRSFQTDARETRTS
jgi:hypothetical protein